MKTSFLARAAPLLALLIAVPAHAAWLDNGDSLCTAINEQSGCAISTDNASGAVISWRDRRNSSTGIDIYARAITYNGTLKWGATGIPICTAANDQTNQVMISDNKGGAIIAWEDSRKTPAGSAIYAQRVRANGNVAWTVNGVVVDTTAGYQLKPSIVPDNASGAILVWEATRSGRSQVYAQHLDSTGVALWAANGIAVAATITEQTDVAAVTDGAGGVIAAWYDARSTAGGYNSIYAQRLNGSGTAPAPWPAGGVGVCDATFFPSIPVIAENDSGGAVVAWEDYRDYGNTGANIYAQRLSASGVVRWAANGVSACSFAGDQVSPTVVPDGVGGAILAWEDVRNGTSNRTIYSQRVAWNGVASWAVDGVNLCTASGRRSYPRNVPDGVGGAITVWQDYRSGLATDIYAQRTSPGGALMWGGNAAVVCDTTNDQQLPVLVGDNASGAVITWHDGRGGAMTSNYDIYAQRLNQNGGFYTGTTAVVWAPAVRFRIEAPRPNPATGPVLLAFGMPDAAAVEIAIFDVAGRVVRRLANGERFEAGSHTVRWDGCDESGVPAPAGLFFVRARAGGADAEARIVRVR